MNFSRYLLPELGILGRLRGTDFYPSHETLERALARGSICVATKSRNLGDALALSTLPGKLRRMYPRLRIETHARGFNPIVFLGNPAVTGVVQAPLAVFGDDCNAGVGHLIQLKERWFSLPVSEEPRPEVHLTEAERAWAKRYLLKHTIPENTQKPLIILHPWGRTNADLLKVEVWNQLVKRWSQRYRFWQLGMKNHEPVQGCEHYFFTAPNRWQARKTFALMPFAQRFIGVDSGPMHLARASFVPSLVISPHPHPELARRDAHNGPWNEGENRLYVTLYEGNLHSNLAQADSMMDQLLENSAASSS